MRDVDLIKTELPAERMSQADRNEFVEDIMSGLPPSKLTTKWRRRLRLPLTEAEVLRLVWEDAAIRAKMEDTIKAHRLMLQLAGAQGLRTAVDKLVEKIDSTGDTAAIKVLLEHVGGFLADADRAPSTQINQMINIPGPLKDATIEEQQAELEAMAARRRRLLSTRKEKK